MDSREVDFRGSYDLLCRALPEFEFEKQGYLLDDMYLLTGVRRGELYAKSRKYFGVKKNGGGILLAPNFSPTDNLIPVALCEGDEVARIEEEVLATGLCKRDDLGRIVTNSEDSYLTLFDGNPLWVPLKGVSDCADELGRKKAYRPVVTLRVKSGDAAAGSSARHYWEVGVDAGFSDRMKRHDPEMNPCDRNFPDEKDLPEWAYCIVGDMIDVYAFGEKDRAIYGTKHFASGTTLYILKDYWESGDDRLAVMGKPRKGHDLIKLICKRSLIHNFRVERITDKRVIRELYLPFGRVELQTDELKDSLYALVEHWKASSPR